MLKRFSQELRSTRLISPNDLVVVGVSAGSDSMALLHLMLRLNQLDEWNLKLHIAHLNHGLRGADADADAAFVQAAADSHSLPCTIEQKDIAKLADAESPGVEEISRRERYAFFERVCLQTGAKVVAVAHHADDHAETILQRILRGTGVRGLAGIPRSRPLSTHSSVRLVRPVLRMTRQSLRTYLADEGVAFREDRTNASVEPTRNRIRNVILPEIEQSINPQVRDALVRLGEQAEWVEEYLRETVQRTFESLIISHTDQQLVLNVDALSRKSRIVQTELIRMGYRSFGLGEQDLSFTHLSAGLDLVADSASGKQLQFPQGMTLEKRYHQLLFSLPSDEPREEIDQEIAVQLPGQTLLPIRRLQIDCSIVDVKPEEVKRLRHARGQMEEYIDFEAVHPPLVVRTRRAGDRFFPLGAPGSKQLSDFLSDTKVDPKERERVAVLCDQLGPIWVIGYRIDDQLGPIWVIGYRIDDRVKLTSLTERALHLSARSLNP